MNCDKMLYNIFIYQNTYNQFILYFNQYILMQQNYLSFDLFDLQNGVVNMGLQEESLLELERYDNSFSNIFSQAPQIRQTQESSKKFENPSTGCGPSNQTIVNQDEHDSWIQVQRPNNFDQRHDVEDIQQDENQYSIHQEQIQKTYQIKQRSLEDELFSPQFGQKQENNQKQSHDKNDSKNVPKGMIKAYAHMILDKKPQVRKCIMRYFEKSGANFQKYQQFAKNIRKSSKISIGQIRQMLTTDEFKETTRTLGNYFIRKRFLNHIYNSKMQKKNIHLKYIKRWKAIFQDPEHFISLK